MREDNAADALEERLVTFSFAARVSGRGRRAGAGVDVRDPGQGHRPPQQPASGDARTERVESSGSEARLAIHSE